MVLGAVAPLKRHGGKAVRFIGIREKGLCF